MCGGVEPYLDNTNLMKKSSRYPDPDQDPAASKSNVCQIVQFDQFKARQWTFSLLSSLIPNFEAPTVLGSDKENKHSEYHPCGRMEIGRSVSPNFQGKMNPKFSGFGLNWKQSGYFLHCNNLITN
ncbi:unnamed protein product [Linum trigynum]|uniref:Uncharacterized protein n=1 Tax=Linum trigynum TaxID=586398 RepID=A0AAV2F247_9ROSI